MPTLSPAPLRFALFIVMVTALPGCAQLLFGVGNGDGPPTPRVDPAVASTHYRDYASADDLARAWRWTQDTQPRVSAHRGGPAPGFPENSLAAFERALTFAPALLETDVRATQDGRLVLLHDETLERTTTGRGRLDETPFERTRRLRLLDPAGAVTPYRIPTLNEALAWAEGRAVLLLDVKEGVPFETLVEEVRRQRAADRAIVITYSVGDAQRVHDLAPEMMLSVTAETPAEARALLDAGIDRSRMIAFVGVGAADSTVIRLMHEAGVRVQVGTFGEMDREARQKAGPSIYAPLLEQGIDVLSTDNVPGAAIAVQRAHR